MALPLLTHIEDYNKPATNKANADKALLWLQYQYQKTDATALKEFEHKWHNGHPPTQPLDFRNVAHYFNPRELHQVQAIQYLDSHISTKTLQTFDDIWFGRKEPDALASIDHQNHSIHQPKTKPTALPILTHIEDYKKPQTNKANADKALVWLHSQYQKTDLAVLKEFEKKWHNGKPSTQPIDFRNVAHYYDRKNAHQTQAIQYLDGHISAATRQYFDDIWFGRKQP